MYTLNNNFLTDFDTALLANNVNSYISIYIILNVANLLPADPVHGEFVLFF